MHKNFNLFFFWGLLIAIINICEIFSVFFWVSVQGFPNDINLAFEIVVDIFLGIDIILKFCLMPYTQHKDKLYLMNMLFTKNDEDGTKFSYFLKDSLILISALPYVSLLSIIDNFYPLDLHTNDLYSYLLFIKLFRFFDILRTKNKILVSLNNYNFILVIFYRILNMIIVLLLTTHVGACFWLFINKAENENFNYYHMNKQKYHNLSDQYMLALEWSVSTMTGTCFGDVNPTTDLEILAAVMIMIIGSTFYCQIFADFETIIYVLRLEKLEKMFFLFHFSFFKWNFIEKVLIEQKNFAF